MKTNGNIKQWCNNTHRGAPHTGKQNYTSASDLGDDQSRYLYNNKENNKNVTNSHHGSVFTANIAPE